MSILPLPTSDKSMVRGKTQPVKHLYDHLPRIKLSGVWFYVDEIGLLDDREPRGCPRQDEIEQALNWFELAMSEGACQTQVTVSSYRIKHIISRWCRSYITNGSAITAAALVGIKQNPERGGNRTLNSLLGINKRWLDHHEASISRAERLLREYRSELRGASK